MTKNILIIVAIIAVAVGFSAAFFLFPRIEEVKIKNPPITLPEGAQRFSPCFDSAGWHWGRPQDLAINTDHPYWTGPEFLYWEPTGKVTGIEYHIEEKYLKEFDVKNSHAESLRFPLNNKEHDHVNLTYIDGHPGFEKPHYDIHMWQLSSEERDKLICPAQ